LTVSRPETVLIRLAGTWFTPSMVTGARLWYHRKVYDDLVRYASCVCTGAR